MIPLPTPIYIFLAELTREINLGGATWIMSKLHMPFLQKDLCIFLPNSTLNVNIGCSGIRYLLSFFVFGIAYSYIFRTKLMNRLLLIGLTIPIAIFAGSIRLSVISFCAYYIGPHMAEHRPHVILSWFVFFIVGMSLIILDKFIMKQRMRKIDLFKARIMTRN
jgi:exosortase